MTVYVNWNERTILNEEDYLKLQESCEDDFINASDSLETLLAEREYSLTDVFDLSNVERKEILEELSKRAEEYVRDEFSDYEQVEIE